MNEAHKMQKEMDRGAFKKGPIMETWRFAPCMTSNAPFAIERVKEVTNKDGNIKFFLNINY